MEILAALIIGWSIVLGASFLSIMKTAWGIPVIFFAIVILFAIWLIGCFLVILFHKVVKELIK